MAGVPRDPRLDFFRGSALVLIFIDHIPSNLFSYFTLHAIAFCDSAEVFIFISGYAAGLVYGGDLQRNGILYCTVRVWRRVWQLYVTHIFLFVVFTATVSYTVSTFNNSMYSEEMQVGHFLVEPHVAIIKALMLEFQPTFLDILPLYIVLLATFSLVLMLLRRNLLFVLVPSLLMYSAVQRFQGLELHTYPGDQTWYFNPFAWQFLFLIGAAFGHAQLARRDLLSADNALVFAAAAFAGAAAAINASWTLHWFYDPFPALLAKQLIPISKTDLAPLRLINALALALLASHWLRPDNRLLQSRLARPLILCGRNSLDIFCISVMLSLGGHFILVEINDHVLTQLLVIFAGFAVMVLAAVVLSYFKSVIAGPQRRAAVDVLQGKPSE